MNLQLTEVKKEMEKALEHMRGEFSRLRVGRATTSTVKSPSGARVIHSSVGEE